MNDTWVGQVAEGGPPTQPSIICSSNQSISHESSCTQAIGLQTDEYEDKNVKYWVMRLLDM